MPTVLITGANRGLGFGFVELFLREGWDVIAVARDPAGAPELQAVAKAHAGKLSIEQCDLADFATIDALGEFQNVSCLLNTTKIQNGWR